MCPPRGQNGCDIYNCTLNVVGQGSKSFAAMGSCHADKQDSSTEQGPQDDP
jgi:hypothetical protein